MAVYHLHYVDPRGKFVHADRIECPTVVFAVDDGYVKVLMLRFELWVLCSLLG